MRTVLIVCELAQGRITPTNNWKACRSFPDIEEIM